MLLPGKSQRTSLAPLALLLGLLIACQPSSDPARPAPSSGATDAASASTAAAASASTAAHAASAAATATAAAAPPPPTYDATPYTNDGEVDVVIHSGQVLNGDGSPAVEADVAIDDGIIVHIGNVPEEVKAKTRIDASGKVVTPGFIDTHSHGDPDGDNNNALSMGVTTLCLGQDGRSYADGRVRTLVKRRKRMAVNIVPFAGHGTVRTVARAGMGKALNDKQISRMVRVVREEMEAGAFGLTTGLEYAPGRLASQAELVALAKPVAEFDGVVMSHMRSEDDDTIDAALDELLAQGHEGGARVHVSHIKVVYGKGAKRAEQLLAKLQQARADGVTVTADIYPYNASYTTISILFPGFAKPPNSFKRAKRDRRDELAEYLRNKVTRRGGPEATLFGTKPFRGKTLAQIAESKGKPFEDVLIDNVGPGGASAAYFVMDDALQSRLLLDPHVMISTDGGPYSRHPRGYGAFAKVLAKHVRERKALSLPEAVRKMSGLPARTLRLDAQKRGLLKIGWAADVLVFDPAAVEDRSTYERPGVYARGMDWVLVNGRAAIAKGKRKNRRGGKVLKRSVPASH